MPPVFGPVSPSPIRLKSCAAGSAIVRVPSVIAKTDTSSPSSSSSITTGPPIAAVARDAPVPELVRGTCDERRLRADDDEIHGERARELEDGLAVFGANRVAVAERGDARVAGSGVELVELRRLRQLPRERVLATARAEQQHLHGGESRGAGR